MLHKHRNLVTITETLNTQISMKNHEKQSAPK
jgi:hypothetical protein